MKLIDFLTADQGDHGAYKGALAGFQRLMSILLLCIGVFYWAIIIGVMPGGSGPFIDMTVAGKVAIVHIAVANLVAAVGLWMRVAWGTVIWIYAALSAVVMHAVYASVFGGNFLLVLFQVLALLIFVVLVIQVRRSTP